jgi:hypothetical protein
VGWALTTVLSSEGEREGGRAGGRRRFGRAGGWVPKVDASRNTNNDYKY